MRSSLLRRRVPLALHCTRGLATAAPAASASAAAAAAPAGGDLYVWGRISEGKLGMRVPESAYNMRDHARPGGPFVLPLLNPSLSGVTDVVCRQARALALTADGSVYSWGSCDNASLGHGDKVQLLHQPRKIEALAGIRIVQVRLAALGWGGVALVAPPLTRLRIARTHAPLGTRTPLHTHLPHTHSD
jgi:hypothetical protein